MDHIGSIALFAVGVVIAAARIAWVVRRNREPPRQQAPRTREGPQVVGFPCVKCGERIVFDSEAGPCEGCGKPVHNRCMPHSHEDDLKKAAPYRD